MSSKYWSKKVETNTKNESWQEPFSRETTVSPKSIQALDVLLGFSGSWAAAHSDRYSSVRVEADSRNTGDTPNNPKWRVSKLGLDGFPELNFIPYNYRTNAHGNKGGSLVGHPISFSVVGSTLKSTSYTWEWIVDGVANTLTLSAGGDTLSDLYGDLSSLVSEGLFLTIPETGALRIGTTGVNQEGMISIGSNALYPKEEYGESAKFEIFRVVSVDMGTGVIQLDTNKPLSNFFEIPDTPVVKGTMFFKPYVTRLAAVPSSGEKGAEKTFMVVSPEHAAFNDLHNPKNTQTEPFNALYAEANQAGQALPVPIPTKNLKGNLESTDNNASKADGAGVFRIYNLPTGHGVPQGSIIHITEVVLFGTEETETFESKELLGWFEVLEVSGSYIQVRREIEVNPSTGDTSFGENLFLDKTSLPSSSVQVAFSVHERVSSIFSGEYNPDKVEACRLKNLIDPAWVDRTTKQVNDDLAGTLYGGSPARADRAIFTTNTDGSTFSDAGSLLDLGFRMVLFPAKEVGGDAVPDFSKPITSLETTIDPTNTTEKQTLSIDYSAGTVTLSHAPTRGGTITPVGIVGSATGGNNPRGEVVLFAACVPFSMEEGQTGIGVSITGGELTSADHGLEEINFKAPLGELISMRTIAGGGFPSSLNVLTTKPLPPRGRMTLIEKELSDPSRSNWSTRYLDGFGKELAPFGYSSRVLNEKVATKNGWEYSYKLVDIFSTNLAIFDIALHDLILRKEHPVITGGVLDDLSYGSAWRSDSIRFAYADLTTNSDGSITVMPTAVKGPSQELRSQFPLGSELELGRVAFNYETQRWVVSSKPYVKPNQDQIGFEVLRGKAYISDKNNAQGIDTPRPVLSLVKEILPSTESVNFVFDTSLATHNGDLQRFSQSRTLSFFTNGIGVKALVEAQTVISQSKDWASETFNGHRFVFAIKSYDGSSSGTEGQNNPIHWVSVEVPDGFPLTALTAVINGEANGAFDVAPAHSYLLNSQERLMLTERYVEVLPSKPYLASSVLSKSITFADNNSMILTIKSADPRYPNRWATVPLKQPQSLSSLDPVEIAAYLNRPLYDRNHVFYVGHHLNEAGFGRGRATVNPYLSGGVSYGATTPAIDPNDIGERQVLFIAFDDPRHPAFGNPSHPDAGKVLLICGGLGRGEFASTTTTVNSIEEFDTTSEPFFNVMVEVGRNEEGNQDMALLLANEFITANPETSVARCGLFYKEGTGGGSSLDTASSPPTSIEFRDGVSTVYAQVNESLFGKFGTLPIDHYLGTYDFTDFNHTGMGVFANLTDFDGVSDRRSPFVDMHRSRIQTYASGTGVVPNLSKWTQHRKRFVRPDLSDPVSLGFYGAWVSYTNQTVEEHEFATPYMGGQDTNINFIANAQQPPILFNIDFDWEGHIYDEVSFIGDQVYLKEDGLDHFANGIILTDGTSEVLALVQDFDLNGTRSFRWRTRAAIFNPLDPTQVKTGAYDAEIIPSSSATLNKYRSTMMVRSQRLFSESDENLGSYENTTYVMGGHVDLFSAQGATNPAGFSLGTFTKNSLSFGFMTHIEQGVFRRGGYGAYDSDPFFSNLDQSSGLVIGATKGADRGTTSSESSVKDGVAGVRFSGDTQIWIKNVYALTSGDRTTAAVVAENRGLTSGILGLGSSSGLMALSGSSAVGVALENIIGTHAPFLVSGGQDESGGTFEQVNVLLGLTQKDLTAWQRMSLEGFSGFPNYVFDDGSSSSLPDQFLLSDTISNGMIVKNLVGKWLNLALPSGETTPHTFVENVGSWQILSTPVISTTRWFTTADGISPLTVIDMLGSKIGLPFSASTNKDTVAVVVVRVGRYTKPSEGFKPSRVIRQNGTDLGYTWSISNHPNEEHPIFCAEVIETGGAPTGINSTIKGLTINPRRLGKSSLPFQLVEDFDDAKLNQDFEQGELFGVFPMADFKGSPKSLAYFTVPNKSASAFDKQESALRGIIRSWNSNTLMEDMAERTFKNSFSVDEDGRVQYQQKQRLGLGVVVDGGLGVVHATGFRANPRPTRRDTVGSVYMFGSAGYPNTDFNGNTAPIHLSSVFDTSEFVDDLLVVGAKSALIFEDARASEGLVTRLKENVIARQGLSHDIGTVKEDIYPNDALFPYNSGGIVFKGTGSVSYERPFNFVSSNAVNPISGFLGKEQGKGLRGMGVPNTGAYLLLPKGPSNLKGIDRGRANWQGGTYNARSTDWLSADSVPLYEFVNSISDSKAAFGFSSLIDNPIGTWKESLYSDPTAPLTHKATGGTIYQGYRHADSRGTSGTHTNATDVQIRVLEGMVVENTTNGTFYSLGETGRHWIESQYSAYLNQLGSTEPVGTGTRPAVQGSRILRSRASIEESDLFYDLNPLVGFENTNILEFCWGTGDRTDTFTDVDTSGTFTSPALTGTDRTHVRDSFIGHNLRITANVEFVPILGKHDIDGGLIPARGLLDENGFPASDPQLEGAYIQDADAIFYSMHYQFKPANGTYGAGDIGKFLYICGTECYQYTGWWVIIDVIPSYTVMPANDSGMSRFIRDVAVVRKWQREGDIEGRPSSGFGALPLKSRSPILKTCGSVANQGWYFKDDTSDLIVVATSGDGNFAWTFSVPSGSISTNGTSLSALQSWLSSQTAYNGVNVYNQLKVLFPAIFTQAISPAFLNWRLEGENDNVGIRNSFTLSYDLTLLTEAEKDFLTGHSAQIYANWQSKDASTFGFQSSMTLSDGGDIGRSGFFTRKGVNSCMDRGAGDRNNALPMGFVLGSVSVQTESAARGLRWVFSHPLTEEHTGGYLHLNRPAKDHFDFDVGGFASPTTDSDPNAPFWVSRYPTYRDLVNNDLHKKIDIFRINRCPSTYNIVVGGDCEIYYREPLGTLTNTRRGQNSMIYSPLSIDFPAIWVDTDTRQHEDIVLFDVSNNVYSVQPLREPSGYSLQPVAREKIVSVNPSSGESNVILDESPCMHIERMESVFGGGAVIPADNLTRIILKNPSAGVGKYYPPQQSLSIGTPIIFRDINAGGALGATAESFNGVVGYVMEIETVQVPIPTTVSSDYEIGTTIIKVFTPSNTGFASHPAAVTVSSGYFAVSEGVRPYQVEGTDASRPWKLLGKEDLLLEGSTSGFKQKMNYASYGNKQVQWMPSSRWWQVMNPATYYGFSYDQNTGVQELVSLNTADKPNVLRIDLTEAFTQAQQSGSGIGSPLKEKTPKGVRLNRIWVNFGLWGNPMTDPSTDNATHERVATPAHISDIGIDGTKHQAMTFNLVLQVPSLGNKPQFVDPYDRVDQSAVGTTPFNGRSPTSTRVEVDSNSYASESNVGSFTIPLYINREAGDLSPNTQERFASMGENNSPLFDWREGDGEYGMGIGSTATASTYNDISDGTTNEWVANASNPVVWGGIDTRKFVKKDLTTGNLDNIFVASSVSPRSSILAKNPQGEIVRSETVLPDDFVDASSLSRSLHPQGISGLTIAHTATLAPPPSKSEGNRGLDLSKSDIQGVNSAPHSFTVALTPIGIKTDTKNTNHSTDQFITPSDEVGRYWNTVNDRAVNVPFLVGDWLRNTTKGLNFNPSMLPVGAKIYLEVAVPHTERPYLTNTETPRTSNGCWVGQVLCSFEVETADGTALTTDINILGEE